MKKKILNIKRLLIIGDIHGRDNWEEILHDNIKSVDEVIFVGDYLDSFTIPADKQIENLENLCSIALGEPKITLLLGNHDYAYIYGLSYISGYQHSFASAYREILESHKDLFKIAWGHYSESNDKYTLISHAGLTYGFWQYTVIPQIESGFLSKFPDIKKMSIHEALNMLIDKKDLLWAIGPRRGGFSHPSPLWADLYELLLDPYPEINQIFGHTTVKNLMLTNSGDTFLLNVDANEKGFAYINI